MLYTNIQDLFYFLSLHIALEKEENFTGMLHLQFHNRENTKNFLSSFEV